MNPTRHAEQRKLERDISDEEIQQAKRSGRDISNEEIQQAKRSGRMLIALHFGADGERSQAEENIRTWGERITQAFPELQIGGTIHKGGRGNPRVELQLVESAARTRELKYWLKDQGYFTEAANRVIYKMRQRDEELVVVEGRVTMSTREQDVGIITTFRNDTSGDHSLQSAIDLYNITFCSLVLVNADEEALDAA